MLAGWTAEYATRLKEFPTPGELMKRLLEPAETPKQDTNVEMPPADIQRLLFEVADALGGKVSIP